MILFDAMRSVVCVAARLPEGPVPVPAPRRGGLRPPVQALARLARRRHVSSAAPAAASSSDSSCPLVSPPTSPR